MEALGFVPFWGFTPPINFFLGTEHRLSDDNEINILISECTDLRHLLRTLEESLPLNQNRKTAFNVYIHERMRENICRDILFLTLICEA